MDTRGSTSLALIVVMQLLFIGMLMTGLFLLTSSVFDKNRFQEHVYAADNALLVDAMLVQDTGMMQAAYLYDQPYAVVVRARQIGVSLPRNDPVYERFATRQGVRIAQGEYQSRLYHWQKSPGSLRVAPLTLKERCPHAQQTYSVTSAKYLATPGISSGRLYDAILSAFLTHGLERGDITQLSSQSFSADFLLITDRTPQEEFLVFHGNSPLAERAGCLLREELQRAGYKAQLSQDPGLEDVGVQIQIPEDIDVEQESEIITNIIKQGLSQVVS